MYSQQVIARSQARLEEAYVQAFPSGLTRYPVPVCAPMTARLASIWDPATKAPTRRLTPEEDAFVAGERLLFKIDFRYGAERYFHINAGGTGLQRMFPLWETQEIVLGELARLQDDRIATGHPDGLLINCLKARQGGLCLDPKTKVLTTDLRWVPLEMVTVGDTLVGTDEEPPGGRGAGRRMRTTVVEGRREVREEAFQLDLDNGVVLIATGPHRFLTRNRGGADTRWRRVDRMVVGEYLRTITKPWEPATLEDAWFGGLLDGEGCLNAAPGRDGAEINMSQVAGPVFDRAETYLRDGEYSYRIERDGSRRASKFGTRPVDRLCVSRMAELFRLLGQTRPTRFIARRWWEGKDLPGKRIGTAWARVVRITPLGPQRMIDLQTSTKTFIAEGVVSHNSTLGAALVTHRVITQTHVRALLASDVPDNSGSEGLFGMYERLVANLPWWLAPAEKFHAKNQHIIFESGSAILVESGKSMKGGLQDKGGSKGQLGRSKTFSTVHLTELSTWEAPEQIDDSLMPAVPRSHRTLGIKESTAKGRHNWHHEDWLVGQRGRGRWTNVFIPWFAEETKYWLPAPTAWVPNEDTLLEARKAEESGPLYLHRPTTLSRNQLYWWEETRATYAEKGQLARFLEEFASDPESCFQASGMSIFTLDQLQYLRRLAKPMIDCWTVAPAKDLSTFKQEELKFAAEARRKENERQEAQRRAPRDAGGLEPEEVVARG